MAVYICWVIIIVVAIGAFHTTIFMYPPAGALEGRCADCCSVLAWVTCKLTCVSVVDAIKVCNAGPMAPDWHPVEAVTLLAGQTLWSTLIITVGICISGCMVASTEVSMFTKGWRVRRLSRALFLCAAWSEFATGESLLVSLPSATALSCTPSTCMLTP